MKQTFPSPSSSSSQELSQIYTFLLQSSLLQQQMSDDGRYDTSAGKRRKRSPKSHEDEDQSEEERQSYDDSEDMEAKQNNNNGNKKKSLQGIITSLLLLDDQDNRESDDLRRESAEEKSRFDRAHSEKTKVAMEHFSASVSDDAETEDFLRAKRKRSRTVAAAAAAAASAPEKAKSGDGSAVHQRRLWVKDRSKAWWDECNGPDFPEEEFRKAFRMGKSTFELICDELNSVIAKEDTTLRNAIPVRQRVAVCLWRLATGDPLRLVSKRFGLGISTCHKLVLEVCSAIKTVLMPKYLQWPDETSSRKIKDSFESLSGIPNIIGSMYTTHIPIIAPKISVAAYFNKRHTERNQKTSYSITVQGVVDPRGVFTDICIGWPGSMADDQVLEKSALHQRASSGGLLKGVWIAGGSGFPLADWILVPYTQQNLTWTQHAFNEKIGEVQSSARGAFARLKGRWSCLQRRTEVKLQDLPVVLGACCVLHNICEMRGEGLEAEHVFELFDDEMVPENPIRSDAARKARDTIAHNLLHHGLAGTAFL